MIIPDIDLLIYAYDSASPFHAASRRWWQDCLNGSQVVAIPWVVTIGFVRLMTTARGGVPAAELSKVRDVVQGWFKLSHVRPIEPSADHLEMLFELMDAVGFDGRHTTDAHLAAIAREMNATVCTADAGFMRFPGVKVHNPMIE